MSLLPYSLGRSGHKCLPRIKRRGHRFHGEEHVEWKTLLQSFLENMLQGGND